MKLITLSSNSSFERALFSLFKPKVEGIFLRESYFLGMDFLVAGVGALWEFSSNSTILFDGSKVVLEVYVLKFCLANPSDNSIFSKSNARLSPSTFLLNADLEHLTRKSRKHPKVKFFPKILSGSSITLLVAIKGLTILCAVS